MRILVPVDGSAPANRAVAHAIGLARGRDDALIATGEQLHLHVDTAAAKAAPMDKALQANLDWLREAHAQLPMPEEAGKPVGSRAKS